jgi:hypothetical protein
MNTDTPCNQGPRRRVLFTLSLSAAAAVALSAMPGTARAEIFVTNRDTNTVGAYTTAGGTVNASLITGLSFPTDVEVFGGNLYVTNYDTGIIGKYTTLGATVNASLITGFTAPFGINVAGGFLYVADAVAGTIGKYNLDGTVVNASLITGLGSTPYGIAVSGTDLFVANIGNDTIGKYTTAGATVDANFITGLTTPTALAVYGGNLFVVNSGGGTIGVYDTATGATVDAALVTGLSVPIDIALSDDGLNLFVTNRDANTVGEYPTSGGMGSPALIEGLNAPFGIAMVDLLQLATAASRKTHGSAGTFDVPLPLTGEPGVECRSTNGKCTFVFTFSSDVVSGSAAVTSGTGRVKGSPSFSDNTMTVNLTGVTDVQKITVTLRDVTSDTAQVLPDTAVSVNMLIGDTNGNKTVNHSDVTQTRGQVGMAVSASNFREDVNVNGAITSADVTLVRSDVGHTLP